MATGGKRITAGPIFVDAGAWIAVSDAADQYHRKGVDTYRTIVRQSRLLVSTNLVIAEAYIALRRVGGHAAGVRFLQTVRKSNRVQKIYSTEAIEDLAEEILVKYADQDFSFVDAVSFAVMRRWEITEAFTFDHHFRTAGYVIVPSDPL